MWRVLFLCAMMMMLNACQPTTERYEWRRVGWNELRLFDAAHAQAGLDAWVSACDTRTQEKVRIFDRHVEASVMQSLCEKARMSDDAYGFLTNHFHLYRVRTNLNNRLHLTGYYIPLLQVNDTPDATYHVPIYARPDEMHRTLHSRAEIDAGALNGKAEIVAYADDAVDVFFLHIQGSGYVEYPDGSRGLLRYAGKNDMPYTAIGKYFIDNKLATKEEMSLQWLKHWLRANPDQASAIMQQNASYVFFDRAAGEAEIIGAQGTPLKAMHSVAIDPAYLSYGVPLFLNAGNDIQRMVITQDTGSAIKGRLRADLFAGAGDDAELLAGKLNRDAALYVLFPKDADYVQQ